MPNKAKTPSAATLEVQSLIHLPKGIKSMNNSISLVEKSQLTMSSRDLLDVINKVRLEENERAVRVNQFHERVADELSDFNYKTFVVENLNNTKSTYFELTQDMCMLVAMRESKKVRRIVLEQLKSKFTQESYSLPQTLPEALRLAAELAEEKLQLEHKVEELEPKAMFHDKVTSTHDAISLAQAAKTLGTGRNRLCSFLRQNKWLRRNNEPYQEKIDQGLLDVKLTNWEHPETGLQQSVTALVTGKGLVRIQSLLVSH